VAARGGRRSTRATRDVGQSNVGLQAEIDAACELIEFAVATSTRAGGCLDEQPISARGSWKRLEIRR